MLYMLEIVQLVSYINYFWQRDRFLIKLGVVLCFIIDTLGTAAVFTWVFMVRYTLILFTYQVVLTSPLVRCSSLG